MSNEQSLSSSEKPVTSAPSSETHEKGFTLERNDRFKDFAKVEVTKTDDSKPWKPPVEVTVTMADGQRVEHLPASTSFYTFHKGDAALTVSAAAAGHIDSLHIRGEDPGSRFDEPSFDALMADVAPKIPDEVTETPGPSAFSVEMGKNMGKEGIAAIDELLKDGTVRSEDVMSATLVKADVIELNKNGTHESKQAFADAFRAKHPESRIQFQLVRGSVLVPVVDAPKRPTTKLFMVFGPDEARPGQKTMWTAAPGRNMPRHPDPKQHMDKDGKLNDETFNESANAWFDTVMLTGE